MMDSPRFNAGLAKALEEKGGVSLMVLSHIDDVGDHQRYGATQRRQCTMYYSIVYNSVLYVVR